MIDEYQTGTEMAWAMKIWRMREQYEEIDEQQAQRRKIDHFDT